MSSGYNHAITIDDNGRFKYKLNVEEDWSIAAERSAAIWWSTYASQWREMPSFYATLCATEGMPAKALRILIVTVVRHVRQRSSKCAGSRLRATSGRGGTG